MPRFTMVCGAHETRIQRVVIRKSALELASVFCPDCKAVMQRLPEPATSRIVETLDNGLMSRRVERPADAESLYKDRASSDSKAKGF